MITLLRAVAPYAAFFALISALLFGAYSFGVSVERDRQLVAIGELNSAHNSTLARINTAHRSALAAEQARARITEQQHAQRMAILDQEHTEALENARNQTERDIDSVRTGTISVRDRFTCPAGSDRAADSGTGNAGPAPGIRDAAQTGGLRPEDAAFLIRLADEADAVVRQLSACQAIVRNDRASMNNTDRAEQGARR